MFECGNMEKFFMNLTSCFAKHLKVTSLNTVLCMSRMTNLLGVPITRSSDGGEIKVAASGPGSQYGFPQEC